MHRTLGLQRGVIVQPTTYGADHSATLDGIAAAGPNYRGCANAAVFDSADDASLDKLHAGGIRGARFSRQSLGIALTPDAFARAIARIRELGWYAKVQPEPAGFAEQAAQYEKLDLPVLIDHMGRPNPAAGRDDPSLKKVHRASQARQFLGDAVARRRRSRKQARRGTMSSRSCAR